MFRVTMKVSGYNEVNFLFETLMETGAFMTLVAKHSESKATFTITEVEDDVQNTESNGD